MYRVSIHAVQRFVQRSRLFLTQDQINSPCQTIMKMAEEGFSHPYCKLYPAYLNMKLLSDIIIYKDWAFYVKGNTIVTVIYRPNTAKAKGWNRNFEI